MTLDPPVTADFTQRVVPTPCGWKANSCIPSSFLVLFSLAGTLLAFPGMMKRIKALRKNKPGFDCLLTLYLDDLGYIT